MAIFLKLDFDLTLFKCGLVLTNMWNNKQIFLWASLVISSAGQQLDENHPKVNIAVYFESLCPDSHNFIINQLYPHWEDIKHHVNIRFIPFGKSISLENGTKFACQHGSKECKGNRIMSCVLSRIPDQDVQVQYLRCFMDVYKYVRIDDSENGQKCAQILGVDFEEVTKNCYQTKEGTHLQLLAEKETNVVRPKFIPAIVYNGVFNQQLQDKSFKNFRDTVCSLIHRFKPDACSYRTVISI